MSLLEITKYWKNNLVTLLVLNNKRAHTEKNWSNLGTFMRDLGSFKLSTSAKVPINQSINESDDDAKR